MQIRSAPDLCILERYFEMNENETLTNIGLSDETIENINNGTVEIRTEIVKEGPGKPGESGKKKGKSGVLKFLLGVAVGFAATITIVLIVSLILIFAFRKNPKNSLLSNSVVYKIDTLKTILDVMYYEDVSEEDMLDGIYRGLINSAGDKYTVYYSADDMKMTNASWEGKFFGIGAVLTLDPASSYTMIDSVELGSPAEKAGIKAGDYIKEVDGTDVAGMSLTDVVKMVRGEEGTEVILTIVRDGEVKEVSIIRGEITMDAVYYEKKEDDIGYIQIATFSDTSVNQFAEKIAEAKKDGIKGLIIDLRGNPGGGLANAVGICEQFMPAGLIVYTEDKEGNRKDYEIDGLNYWDIPLVVLTDEGSASASEIMTAAVKDSGVGTIVGKKTYGKGIYQSVVPLPDGSAVKVTAGRFFSPKGVCFHQVGIEPDVEVELDVDKYLDKEIDTQLDKGIEVLKEKMEKK